jgi:nucleoside-diphosphate kinase
MVERTLIIIKPDGVQRHLTGEIISRFERKGFKIVAAKLMSVSKATAKKHYAVHKDQAFYEGVVDYLSSAPVMVMVLEAEGGIKMARKLMGRTFGYEAKPGTIRGDFGCSRGYNLVHGSDSPGSAEYEIPLFFSPEEIIDYDLSDDKWLYGRND